MANSRIAGFFKLPKEQKLAALQQQTDLNQQDMLAWDNGGLTYENADHMIENVIGLHSLPVGIGLNFQVNGRDVLVPMVLEEPSVVAGASFMAKLARSTGGFTAKSTPPEMIGQIQVLNIADMEQAITNVNLRKSQLIEMADGIDPILKKFGGGARDLIIRRFDQSPVGPFLVLHLIYDVRDAMGANAVNTACEKLAPEIEQATGGKVHLKILSNLADRRVTTASCRIPASELAFDGYSGEEVRDGIIAAYAFAAVDPYRAATHNKGIMNGIDAVVMATGNDWRAIEAGAHAFAARNGNYTSLSKWWKNDAGDLLGELEIPMAVGTIGGATKVHPAAKAAIKLMGVRTATELAEVIVSVGLAQNLAAIRALATEGIQKGHMGLHARQVAIAAGANSDEVDVISARMVEQKAIRVDLAEKLIWELRNLGAKE